MIYLDSSGLVKLFRPEKESGALRSYLDEMHGQIVSSLLTKVEAMRTARLLGTAAIASAQQILDLIDLVPPDDEVIDIAARVLPVGLRALDAIQVATAFRLREQVTEFITYDRRMIEAAIELGFSVSSPN